MSIEFSHNLIETKSNGIILETERLIIRPFKEDEAYIVALNSRQPSVAEAMSDMVLADEKSGLEWIKMINGIINLNKPCLVLGIELKKEKKCIGIIGVVPQSKIQGEIEILFSVSDEYQNKGYATEASTSIVSWFFSLKKHDYLSAIVKINNIPSQKVIEKLGFNFIENRKIIYDYKPTMFKYYKLYSIS